MQQFHSNSAKQSSCWNASISLACTEQQLDDQQLFFAEQQSIWYSFLSQKFFPPYTALNLQIAFVMFSEMVRLLLKDSQNTFCNWTLYIRASSQNCSYHVLQKKSWTCVGHAAWQSVSFASQYTTTSSSSAAQKIPESSDSTGIWKATYNQRPYLCVPTRTSQRVQLP